MRNSRDLNSRHALTDILIALIQICKLKKSSVRYIFKAISSRECSFEVDLFENKMKNG